MPLSDAKCRAAKGDLRLKKLSDGGGLQLWVQPNGARLWRLAYRYRGKQKLLSLGAYPAVSVLMARVEREKAKRLLAEGNDPSEVKKSIKLKDSNSDSFQKVAGELLVLQKRNGRSQVTIAKTEWLLDFALPTLGPKSVTEISAPEILQILRKTEARGKYETARRLRSTIGRVFKLAVATGRAENDPTYSLHGALANPPIKSHAAITEPKSVGALLRAIDGFEGQPSTNAALKLLPLLFPRPGELRAAAWIEFEFDDAVWSIPASRTKLRRAHKIPLPRQAIKILQNLRDITGSGILAFPSVRTNLKPISENTLNAALRRLGYEKDDATSHGFRATASTLLNQSGKWHADAIERQLAHVERDDVRRAYLRGEHWEERIAMMQWWADYLDNLKVVGKVFPIPHLAHVSNE